MSDRSTGSGEKPLFQGMDERERELAPQQVPGDVRPDLEDSDRGPDEPHATTIPAVPPGAVTGAGSSPTPTATGGGAGVAPVPPLLAENEDDAREVL